jgi:tetratricopeptide (TPR) repeat protein
MVTALWLAIWRRYYSKVPAIVVAGGLAALGLATSVPLLLARPDVWEVPISCAYALVMLMLGALWRALHDSTRRTVWLAVAASALGLAIGARPWLVLACPALLVPAVTGAGSIGVPGRRRRLLTDLVAIGLPLAAIGLCLALYNLRRFDSIFEFGQRYQLAEDRQDAARHFSLTYLWFNFRVYFLSVATWDSRFPFVTGVSSLPPPAGHAEVDQPFGLLTNTPVTAFALYLLLRGRESFRTRPAELRAFVGIVAGVFAVGAVTLCLFYGTCTRYQVEFHPALTLLAALGGLAWISSTQGSRASRRAITTLWLATVAASVIVESLRSWHGRVDQLVARAAALETERRPFQALSLYQEAIRSSPDRVDLRYQAALLLEELGMTSAAITEHEALLQVDPFHVGGCNRLGRLLANARRGAEAVRLFHRVVGMQPQYPEAHFNLGLAFQLENRHGEAIRCFEETLRLRPGFPLAHRQRAISLQAAAVPRP